MSVGQGEGQPEEPLAAIVEQLADYTATTPEEEALVGVARLVQAAWRINELAPVGETLLSDRQAEIARTTALLGEVHRRPLPVIALVERVEGQLIGRGRILGVTWKNLGKILNISAQGAQQKFSSK